MGVAKEVVRSRVRSQDETEPTGLSLDVTFPSECTCLSPVPKGQPHIPEYLHFLIIKGERSRRRQRLLYHSSSVAVKWDQNSLPQPEGL